MKLYSWNVNGFRAVVTKGFWDWFKGADADVVCLQETKADADQAGQHPLESNGYEVFWNPSRVKKGYSGVACFSRIKPLRYGYGFPDGSHAGEGRLIWLEFASFFLLNVYFPNGQMNEERLKFKLTYYDRFLQFAEELRASKPVVVCGDFNTAHKEIDLKNPKANEKTSGFLPIERAWMDTFVGHGYVDTFRMFTPAPGNYSWWTYRFDARARNVGWRIDYFFVSEELKSKVRQAWIDPQVYGSDHCPVGLDLDIS